MNYRVRSALLSSLSSTNENMGDANANGDNFDGQEFSDVLKSASSNWGKKLESPNTDILNNMKEEIYREYPYSDINLPILSECNQYYSGKYEVSENKTYYMSFVIHNIKCAFSKYTPHKQRNIFGIKMLIKSFFTFPY